MKNYLALGGLAFLTACASVQGDGTPDVPELSPETIALLPPGQDLTTLRLMADNCYWYLHEGPVESTYIPLRTRDERVVCVAEPE